MESLDLVRYFIAVTFVLLLAGIALLVKRYAANPSAFRIGLKTRIGKWEFTPPQRRITVVESLMVGPRQRLIIVRRDDIEHLVLSGPDGATVIEAGFTAPVRDVAAPGSSS
jgi:flagellar protein FliO/FliZ